MKTIKECYPDDVRDDGTLRGWGVSDYDPLLQSLGHEVLLKVDDNDYQGDSRLILKNGDRYGLLIFGWGSCSGCDALQACGTVEEIEELRDGLANGIIWHDSRQAMLDFIKSRDWEVQFSWHDEETKEFVEKAIAMLSGSAGN